MRMREAPMPSTTVSAAVSSSWLVLSCLVHKVCVSNRKRLVFTGSTTCGDGGGVFNFAAGIPLLKPVVEKFGHSRLLWHNALAILCSQKRAIVGLDARFSHFSSC